MFAGGAGGIGGFGGDTRYATLYATHPSKV